MRKKTKWISLLLALVMVMVVFAGCGDKKDASKEDEGTQQAEQKPAYEDGPVVKVIGLKGPTGMGMVGLMQKNDAKETANQYQVTMAGAPDEVVGKISSGEVDIAGVPTNMAATLYNKTNGGVEVIALNTLGVLYVLEDGDTIHSVADLKGKMLTSSGQATTPQFILDYILKANGIDPTKDLTVDYKSEHSEVVALAAAGKAKIAVLPEPHVTAAMAQNPNLRVALDLTEEWKKACELTGAKDNTLAMGCFIVRKEFAEKNPEAVNTFLKEYKESADFVNSNNEAAAKLIEQYGIMPKAAVALKALPKCNIVAIEGEPMETAMEQMLQVFYNADPKSVGGKLPGDDFYYKN